MVVSSMLRCLLLQVTEINSGFKLFSSSRTVIIFSSPTCVLGGNISYDKVGRFCCIDSLMADILSCNQYGLSYQFLHI